VARGAREIIGPVGELAIPDPSVVILVGAAGAGKSTFALRHFPADAVLSSDRYREAIAGDAADQAVTRAAFASLHRALDRRLADGRLTVVDATNLTSDARRKVRGVAARHGVPALAIVFDLPGEEVRQRNALRLERVVPDAVVSRHLAQLAAAIAGQLGDEGYVGIVHLRDQAAVDAVTVRLVRRAPGEPREPADASADWGPLNPRSRR
jgi:protein phosphatase